LRVVVLRLVPHPDTPCRAVERIEVRVERRPAGRLALAYRLEGNLAEIRIPSPRPPAFADGLWRATCCEAFVGGEGRAYEEYNFSPSGEYAAYRFDSYRTGMRPFAPGLQVTVHAGSSSLTLECEIPASAGKLGLAAIVEAERMSYWALRHAPGKPDFHHPDAFAFDLDEIRH
jgi:hypothetical protein